MTVAKTEDITAQAKTLLIAYADLIATDPEDDFLIDTETDHFSMDLELLKAATPGHAPDRFVVYAAIGIARWYAENHLNRTLTQLIQESVKSSFATDLYAAVRRYPNL